MAGGKISEALIYGLTVRESATDGSDFSNPAADYRRLYLGEDGQLHVKDSAGAVTDIGSGSGNVATDAIWDAAGDLAVGSGANTAAKLTKGSDGTVLTVTAGAVGWAAAAGGLLQAQKVKRTSGNVTTTSVEPTWTDATGMSITMTTGAHRCLVELTINAISSGSYYTFFDLAIDGTRQGEQFGLSSAHGGAARPASFTFLTDVLSAASHTFKLQMALEVAGTGTLYASTVQWPAIMSVTETALTT